MNTEHTYPLHNTVTRHHIYECIALSRNCVNRYAKGNTPLHVDLISNTNIAHMCYHSLNKTLQAAK